MLYLDPHLRSSPILGDGKNDRESVGGAAARAGTRALLILSRTVIFVVRIEKAEALQSNHAHHVEDDQRER